MLMTNFEKIPSTLTNVNKYQNKNFSRTYFKKILKEEEKFSDATECFESSLDNLSLRAIPDFCKAVKHFVVMSWEKLKYIYYSKK